MTGPAWAVWLARRLGVKRRVFDHQEAAVALSWFLKEEASLKRAVERTKSYADQNATLVGPAWAVRLAGWLGVRP